jgi:hypothetical protein
LLVKDAGWYTSFNHQRTAALFARIVDGGSMAFFHADLQTGKEAPLACLNGHETEAVGFINDRPHAVRPNERGEATLYQIDLLSRRGPQLTNALPLPKGTKGPFVFTDAGVVGVKQGKAASLLVQQNAVTLAPVVIDF